MKYYVLIWVEFNIPGFLVKKFLPAHLRPVLGEARPMIRNFSKLENAERVIHKLKQINNPRLYACKGLRMQEISISYTTAAKIGREQT